MRNLVLVVHISLDGFVAGVKGELDGFDAGEEREHRQRDDHEHEDIEAKHGILPERTPFPAWLKCGRAASPRQGRFRRPLLVGPGSEQVQGLIQPCSSRRTTWEITAMPASLSLRQGIAAKFVPP